MKESIADSYTKAFRFVSATKSFCGQHMLASGWWYCHFSVWCFSLQIADAIKPGQAVSVSNDKVFISFHRKSKLDFSQGSVVVSGRCKPSRGLCPRFQGCHCAVATAMLLLVML